MTILNKLLGLDLPTPQQLVEQTTQNSENMDTIASVTFFLQQNGDVSVKYFWSEETQAMAKILGNMLYFICSGNMITPMTNILFAYGNEHIQSKKFIQKILNEWHITINKYEQRPIISPTNVLQLNKQFIITEAQDKD